MKTTIKAALMSASVLGMSSMAHAEADARIINGELLNENETIVENAMKVQNFSTLVAAVEAAGLAPELMGEGPYTIFAPTDEAFAELPEGTVEELLKPENRDRLAELLQGHVVQGLYTSGDLDVAFLQSEEQLNSNPQIDKVGTMIEVDTLASTDIVIDKVGDSFYLDSDLGTDENARVIAADIMTSNGVIHVINGVLTPAS